jgi:hypothetical protein
VDKRFSFLLSTKPNTNQPSIATALKIKKPLTGIIPGPAVLKILIQPSFASQLHVNNRYNYVTLPHYCSPVKASILLKYWPVFISSSVNFRTSGNLT